MKEKTLKEISLKEKQELLTTARSCEDHAPTDELERMGRNLYRQIEPLSLTKDQTDKLKKVLQEARSAMDSGQNHTAEYLLREAPGIWKKTESSAEVDKSTECGTMQNTGRTFLGRLKSVFSGSRSESQDDPEVGLVRSEYVQAEKQMYALQDKISGLYKRHEARLKELQQMADECAAFSVESSGYQMAKLRAMPVMAEIKNLENQINQAAGILKQNIQYCSMLQAGTMNFELKKFIPDTAKVQAVMDLITDTAADLYEDLNEMDEALTEHEQAIEKARNKSLKSLKAAMEEELIEPSEEVKTHSENLEKESCRMEADEI